MVSTKEVIEKYSRQLGQKIGSDTTTAKNYSKEYQKFRDETIPAFSSYERWCNALGSIIHFKVSQKDYDKVQKQLSIAHLQTTPEQALGLSVVSFVSVFLLTLLFCTGIFLITNTIPVLVFFLGVVGSFFVYYVTYTYPQRLAIRWRLKASSQMVPAILYIVVYMRHTSNLERAIGFAAEHLQPPLSLDLRKIFYNVQVGKYTTIKESLDAYLETWRDSSSEFIEAFHLIESSLFEVNDAQRIRTLEKSLQVVLDGVYDKMLRFTHDVRSPLTNVYMLGVILPTLGLALLPLASTLLPGLLQWYHVFILFNILVQFFVVYLTKNVLAQRPGGYGETELVEQHPLYYQYASNKPYIIGALLALPFLILGLLPLIFHFTPILSWFGITSDVTFAQIGMPFFGESLFFGFQDSNGPFGIGSLLLSLAIPFGAMLMFAYVFRAKTKEIILQRNDTRALEKEFASSLFQVGNRLGDGVPAELVFGKVAESAQGLKTEAFFRRVNYNVQQQGMSVERALFDPQRGATLYYPSQLIRTSMKILVESSKKGLAIAAQSLMAISEYIKNIEKINDRLRDLLAEIISDMKSNMTFLAPLLAGVVVGLAGMITLILSKLQLLELAGSDIGNLSTLLSIFDVANMIPPYYLQIAIGIYLIEIIFILTATLVTVDAGEDTLQKTHLTGKNLVRGLMLYLITAGLSIVVLSILSSVVLTGFK